jgi:NDP-4-keto-2,6-dideoxyhexose 3-C-methyltransferase
VRAIPIDGCRVCGHPNFAPFLDLGEMAPCGIFPVSAENQPAKEPLVVVRCLDCGLAQLAHDLPPKDTFNGGFGYRSATNPTMRRHLEDLAKHLYGAADLKPGDLVIDIASNDGTFLAALPSSVRKVGVDPVASVYEDFYPVEAVIHSDFWSDDLAREYAGQAKAITCFAALYDAPDPNAFMRDVATALQPGGVFLCEVAGLPGMLATGAFDLVSHEHLCYFHWHPLDRLLRQHGLALDWPSVSSNLTNGGSVLFTARKTDQPIHPWPSHQPSGHDIGRFIARVQTIQAQVRGFLMGAQSDGKIVHGLCASTRGNTLLQSIGANVDCVQAISDRNQAKWGRLTPGSLITIISPENSRAQEPDYYLNLAWHYPNLIEEETAFLERGGTMVVPFPNALRFVTKETMADAV